MDREKEPQSYERAGHSLKCPICGNGTFWEKEAQLNTKTATFFGWDWANPSGDCYICASCRHILWFYGEAENP